MLLLVKQYLILAENIQSEHEKREERTDTSSCESDVLQIARGNLVPFSSNWIGKSSVKEAGSNKRIANVTMVTVGWQKSLGQKPLKSVLFI